MKDSTVKHKIHVFISSKCGGKYTIARKALQELLLSTGLTEVYLFESEAGSSQDTVSAYLEYIDESNLCVFLVDNDDGITDAVLSEQKRAKEKGLKLIYIFCDETNQTPTAMQQEIKQSLSEKYVIVHEFSDIVTSAYESVIQDVVSFYKKKLPINGSEKINAKEETVSKSVSMDPYIIPKNEFLGFELTKNEILKLITHKSGNIATPSITDKYMLKFLQFVLKKTTFDINNFDSLVKNIISLQSKSLTSFLNYRFSAIKFYYEGQLKECINKLSNAIDEATTNDKIPNWLANDVAIDIRNITIILNETENQHIDSAEISGQKFIDENPETVYYPLLDRKTSSFYKEINEQYFYHETISPYTTSFGGLESIFNNIAETFCIAVMNGSITNIEFLREYLISALLMVCNYYNDHDVYLELLRLLIVNRNENIIEKLVRIYNVPCDIVNKNDIELILNSISNISYTYKQIMSKCLLMKYFGYYFSDKDYTTVSSELFEYSNNWITNNKRIPNMGNYLFDFMGENTYRLNGNNIISFVIKIFKNELRYWYNDCCQLIRKVNFKNVMDEKQLVLRNILVDIVNNSEIRNNIHYLDYAIISFCLNTTVDTEPIKIALKTQMPKFYSTTYDLEINSKSYEDNCCHIERYLEMAHKHNEAQGKSGRYIGYAFEPYMIIQNIIDFNNVELTNDKLEDIIEIIKETLATESQTIAAKINAIQLLMFLQHRFINYPHWDNLKFELIKFSSTYSKGHEIGFFEKDSQQTLLFAFSLLLECFGQREEENLIEYIFTSINNDNYEIIKALQLLENFLIDINNSTVGNSLINAVTHYSILMSTNKERDIKFYAIKSLILLTHFDYQRDLVLKQLSRLMDTGSAEIKISIISRVKELKSHDRRFIDYILQKGKVDNNYLVRHIANQQSKTFENGNDC